MAEGRILRSLKEPSAKISKFIINDPSVNFAC